MRLLDVCERMKDLGGVEGSLDLGLKYAYDGGKAYKCGGIWRISLGKME